MEEFLHTYGMKLAALVLAIIFGKIGYEAGKLAVKYLSTTIKREIAEKSMQYVEQVYKLLHGEEKMQKALETARVFLAKLGMKFDAEEMRFLIEAAVGAFNEGFRKGHGQNDSWALPESAEPDEPEDLPNQMEIFEDEKETSGLLEE